MLNKKLRADGNHHYNLKQKHQMEHKVKSHIKMHVVKRNHPPNNNKLKELMFRFLNRHTCAYPFLFSGTYFFSVKSLIISIKRLKILVDTF